MYDRTGWILVRKPTSHAILPTDTQAPSPEPGSSTSYHHEISPDE
jgi:hypothetical protein